MRSRWTGCILALAVTPYVAMTASAQWQGVDDVDGLNPGSIDGQGSWITANPDNAQVVADPADGSNQVIAISDAGHNSYIPLPAPIPDGTTGTIFFRARAPEDVDFVLGSSDVAEPDTWDHYEGYMRFAGNNIDVRDGGGFAPAVEGYTADAWYNIWLVVNNDDKNTKLYYSIGADAEGILGFEGAFRETAGNAEHGDLINFLVRTGNPHDGLTAYLDDIYVDVSGTNLTNPTATIEPPETDANFDDRKARQAFFVEEPPTIDGFIDPDEWSRAEGAGNWWRMRVDDSEDGWRGGEIANGELPEDDIDLSVDMYVSYDENNLYVGVRVIDFDIVTDSAEEGSANGMTWQDDSVEIFIDGDNSNWPERDTTGSNPEVVDTGGQFVISANNAYREAEAGDPGFGEEAAWHAVADARVEEDGYETEFRISLDAIGNPKPGDVVGFSIAVNDDDDGDDQERQVIWTGATHVEESYGNLVFGKKSYTAPKTAAAPEIDGVINDGEYAGADPLTVTPYSGFYHLGAGDDDFTPEDHSYTAWVTHDDDAIYVAVDVTDDMVVNDSAGEGEEDGQTWHDDGVEIFFDADDSDLGGRPQDGDGQKFDGQYVYTANGAWRDNEANNPTFGEEDDWFAAGKSSDTNFVVEFRVTKNALLDIAEDTPIGFNMCINDDDGETGNRKAQLNWSGVPHTEFSYGELILSSQTGKGGSGLGIPRITRFQVDTATRNVTIEWASRTGKTYTLERTTNFDLWEELEDGIESGGETTSFQDAGVPADIDEAYYRVIEL